MELIYNFIKHFLTLTIDNIKAIPTTDVVDELGDGTVLGTNFLYTFERNMYSVSVLKDSIYIDSFPKRSQLRLNVNRETCVYSVDNPELIITSDMVKFTKLLTKIY